MISRGNRNLDEALSRPDLILEAMRQGVRQAVREHKRAGLPMVGWRDGQVVWIPPEELPDGDEPSDPPPPKE